MKSARETIFECFEHLNPESVLDLGCGDSKFTIRFARKGARVIGVDKDKIEIQECNFNFIQEDIRDFEFTKEYDLVFTSMVLHFLKKEEAIEIIERMKKNTSINGFNFIICMSSKDDSAKRNPRDFYPCPEELNSLYHNWKIIKNESCLSKKHQHNNGEFHQHKTIVFLAKNKG
jgi:tellurite methyltransferase